MRQFSLWSTLELTAACGFAFAMVPTRDLVAYGLTLAVLAVWSLRASRWPLRWLLFNWLGGTSMLLFSLACLERAMTQDALQYPHAAYWLLGSGTCLVWAVLAGFNGIPFLAESLGVGREAP